MNHILINDKGVTVDLRLINDRVLCIYRYKPNNRNYIDAPDKKRAWFMKHTKNMTDAVNFWRRFYGFRKLVSY